MVKYILFDADGVLAVGKYVSHYLEKDYGISHEVSGEFFHGIFLECIVGKKDLKKEITPYLKKWGWKKSVDDFVKYWHKVEHVVDDELIAYIQILRSRGFKCYVATNQEKYRLKYMLKDMSFENAFDGVFGSENLGHSKPDRNFFKKILRLLKIRDIKEVLFWDDSEENILAAKEIGINAEHYKGYDDFKQKMESYLN